MGDLRRAVADPEDKAARLQAVAQAMRDGQEPPWEARVLAHLDPTFALATGLPSEGVVSGLALAKSGTESRDEDEDAWDGWIEKEWGRWPCVEMMDPEGPWNHPLSFGEVKVRAGEILADITDSGDIPPPLQDYLDNHGGRRALICALLKGWLNEDDAAKALRVLGEGRLRRTLREFVEGRRW